MLKIIKILYFSLIISLSLFSIASAANLTLVPCTGLDCTWNHVYILIARIIDFMLYIIAIPCSALFIAWGGFKLMMSRGSAGGRKQAQDTMTAAVVGLAISFGAWIIINTVLQGLCLAANGKGGISFTPWKTIENCSYTKEIQ